MYIGRKHDFSILKEEFETDINWFKNLKVRLDLGYTGFENYYNAKEVIIPKKKPKNKELNQSDIDDNKLKAKKRIKVEHCISGIKRYRILSIKNRIHDLCSLSRELGQISI